MKSLLGILGGGLVVFMLLAISEEWRFFSSAWFGNGAPEVLLSADDRRAASEALYVFLRVSSHYYASGGDPRFVERLPAGEGVLAELKADVEYLRRNHFLQDARLGRLEVVSAEQLAAGRVELQTREWWHTRTLWIEDGTDAEPPRAFRWSGRYLLTRAARGWLVEAWNPVEESPTPAGSQAP